MSVTHRDRFARLEQLYGKIPHAGTAPERCPDVARLEQLLGDTYGGDASPEAQGRRLQRDLAQLVADERIVAVNPGGKPLRYRRVAEETDDDPRVLAFTRQQIANAVADLVPEGRLDALWRRLLLGGDEPVFDDRQLRILPDAQRLLPAEVYPGILSAAIAAVAQRLVLDVGYQKADGERSDPRLHPQALVQRGPVIYLVALKNDEPAHVQFYALHRMLRADLSDEPARVAQGFDLDQAIEQGLIDFGPGELIELELRVRGYLADVLEDCPLAKGQHVEWEPEDSAFTLRLRAQVPSSGALLRWLMAAGDKVEVVAPPALRHAVAVQAAKTASLYGSAAD